MTVGGGDGAVQRIFEDYRTSSSFFDLDSESGSSALPIETVMSGMDFVSRPKSLYLTLGTALNFQREAMTLRKRTAALWETEHWIYQPETLVAGRYNDLVDLFKGRNRYEDHSVVAEHGRMERGRRDANIWYTVATTLYEEYDSNPMHLLEEYEYDAKSIFDHAKEDRRDEPAHESIEMTKAFPYLGGDKVGPLWLRLLDDLVHPLDRIHLLPLPVDRQIVKITNVIFGTEYSREPTEAEKREIREIWYPKGKEHDLSAADVDDALWRIAEEENWRNGGREYVLEMIE